jgi:hypothetical protein
MTLLTKTSNHEVLHNLSLSMFGFFVVCGITHFLSRMLFLVAFFVCATTAQSYYIANERYFYEDAPYVLEEVNIAEDDTSNAKQELSV